VLVDLDARCLVVASRAPRPLLPAPPRRPDPRTVAGPEAVRATSPRRTLRAAS
jgi:hypothetical protein